MSDWDDSDSSSEDDKPAAPPSKPTTTAQPESSPPKEKKVKKADVWDESDESSAAEEADEPNQANNEADSPQKQSQSTTETPDTSATTSPNKAAATAESAPKSLEDMDAEEAARMRKKMQNYKAKQAAKKRKQSAKQAAAAKKRSIQGSGKKPPISLKQTSQSGKIPKGQDELLELSSSDSSSDSTDDATKAGKKTKKAKKKMQSYADRMKDDNDILFQGLDEPKKKERSNKIAAPVVETDSRPMMSGEVTLKNFPLGSTRDCERLADEITALLDGCRFRGEIDENDIFMFFKKLVSSKLAAERLDMYATQELSTKMNALHSANHKAYQKKKNPKGKKKKVPQYLMSKHGNGYGQFKEGQYNKDEYSLFE